MSSEGESIQTEYVGMEENIPWVESYLALQPTMQENESAIRNWQRWGFLPRKLNSTQPEILLQQLKEQQLSGLDMMTVSRIVDFVTTDDTERRNLTSVALEHLRRRDSTSKTDKYIHLANQMWTGVEIDPEDWQQGSRFIALRAQAIFDVVETFDKPSIWNRRRSSHNLKFMRTYNGIPAIEYISSEHVLYQIFLLPGGALQQSNQFNPYLHHVSEEFLQRWRQNGRILDDGLLFQDSDFFKKTGLTLLEASVLNRFEARFGMIPPRVYWDLKLCLGTIRRNEMTKPGKILTDHTRGVVNERQRLSALFHENDIAVRTDEDKTSLIKYLHDMQIVLLGKHLRDQTRATTLLTHGFEEFFSKIQQAV